jgi:hypothetical protein
MNIRVVYGKQVGKMLNEDGSLNEVNKPTSFYEMSAKDVGLKPEISKVESEAFTASRFAGDGFVSRVKLAGTIDSEVSRLMLQNILPNASFETNTTGVFVPKQGISTDYFMIVVEDLDQESHDIYYDCITNILTLSMTKEAYIGLSLDMFGTKASVADGLYSYPVDSPVAIKTDETLRALDLQMLLDSTDNSFLLSSVTLTIDNSLEDRAPINSPYTNRVVNTGNATIKVDVSYDWYRKQDYIAYFNKTTENTKFSGSLVLTTPYGADAGKKVTIGMPNMKSSTVTRGDLTGAGTLDTSFDAYFNSAGIDADTKAPITFTFEA